MLREIIEQIDKLPQKALLNCTEIDVKKPCIGIISAQNDTTSAHHDLEAICERVKLGAVSNGATAKIAHIPSIDCTALHGTQATKYDLPSRELTANAVELICANDLFDAVVFVASEPNVVCGMLIAAIRLNIPCAFVCQGVLAPIYYNGKQYGFLHYFEQIVKIKSGKTAFEDLSEIETNLPVVLGTDCERYGANSFNCILEATGLAVRGNGTAPAQSVERTNIAHKTGALAVKFAAQKWTPRRALTQEMFNNLCVLDLACGGSTTTMLNLIALSKEVGLKCVTMNSISDLSKNTPQLLAEEDDDLCIMTQFHKAGGAYGMLRQLADARLLSTDVSVDENTTLSQLISEVAIANENVIRKPKNCVMRSSRLRVLFGNVAEGGCFAQIKGEGSFTGEVKVYDNEELAVDALLHREIRPGDIVVVRSEGPRSGPGMREIYTTLAMLKGFGLSDKVAVITDGRIADFYPGIVVGHITPETYDENSVLTVLQDGDVVDISAAKGKISCDLTAKELTQRFRENDGSIGSYGNIYLKNWAKTCTSASDGCVAKGRR